MGVRDWALGLGVAIAGMGGAKAEAPQPGREDLTRPAIEKLSPIATEEDKQFHAEVKKQDMEAIARIFQERPILTEAQKVEVYNIIVAEMTQDIGSVKFQNKSGSYTSQDLAALRAAAEHGVTEFILNSVDAECRKQLEGYQAAEDKLRKELPRQELEQKLEGSVGQTLEVQILRQKLIVSDDITKNLSDLNMYVMGAVYAESLNLLRAKMK